jgi:hydroxypyruvate isomerase
MRLAANLAFMFSEYPLRERFAAAAAAGFTAVELHEPYDVDPAALRAEIARTGLTMLGVNIRARETTGCAALAGCEAAFAADFAEALDYVTALGGRSVHCLAGVSGGRPVHGPLIENLQWAADQALARGKTVLIEPLNHRDRPGYAIATVEQAADLLNRVGRSNVKIQFDFYHAQIAGGDLIARFGRFLPLIGHVQIAAVPSRAEPDEGEINYPAIFATIDASGYDGYVACEYRPRGRTEAGLDWARSWLHPAVCAPAKS